MREKNHEFAYCFQHAICAESASQRRICGIPMGECACCAGATPMRMFYALFIGQQVTSQHPRYPGTRTYLQAATR